MEKERILLAEDEKDLARALGTILEYSKYKVDIVHNGLDAVNLTQNEKFSVIILDIMMPIMDGIEALKQMRKNGINTPVILLTAKAQVDDKVEGLDAGADDYLTKPFDKKELLARIRALLRKNGNSKIKYQIGNIIFNKENSEISNSKTSFILNNKECEIMEILLKNQERNVSKDEIEKRVWEDTKNYEGAVNMYMSYLQEKFNALDANIKINNENNGYILEQKL